MRHITCLVMVSSGPAGTDHIIWIRLFRKTYKRILTTTIVQSKYVLLELLSMQIMFSIIFGAFMVSFIIKPLY